MQIIKPVVVTDGVLVSSNIPEDDYGVWKGVSPIQSVSLESKAPGTSSVFFKPDGTKLYALRSGGSAKPNEIVEYDLDTAWDISTLGFAQAFSISTQETIPEGLFFKPDGTKAYVVGRAGQDVNEYNLSVAWDISTTSFVQAFSVSAREANPTGVFFRSDGAKMYVVGYASDNVNEYNLSVAWNVSTATFVQAFSIGSQGESNTQDVFFKSDGTKMYTIGSNAKFIEEYNLSTAWNVSTATFSTKYNPGLGFPLAVVLKPDGERLFAVDSIGSAVYEFQLPDPWTLVGSTYSISNRVILLDNHKIYESRTNGNTNVYPATDSGTNWLEISATNRWKAFDKKISDPVVAKTSIEYTLASPEIYVTSVALFGLVGNTATVVVTDVGGDGEVYNETKSLIDNSNVFDWFSYFFEPIAQKTEIIFTDIPPYKEAEVEISVLGASNETVKLGQIVFGTLEGLGLTVYGTSVGIEDFSRKETDIFGNFIIVERVFSYTVDYDVRIPTGSTKRVQNLLATYRASPLVYIGNSDDSYGTIVYGFYRNFDINLETPSYALASIEVEGLT